MNIPAHYIRIKPFGETSFKSSRFRFQYLKDKYRLTFSLLGLMLIFLGAFILFSQLFFPKWVALSKVSFVKPVSGEYFSELASKKEYFVFQELLKKQKEIQEVQKTVAEEIPPEFYLSIPKLGIDRALVEAESTDASPDEKLGHFKGSSLPDKNGNVFIYGHSTLKALYKPSDYKTIFSKIDELTFGDEILIDYLEKQYRYVVKSQEILDPEEVDPLDIKNVGEESLTLMTCTPPGATTQRLLVYATKTYQ